MAQAMKRDVRDDGTMLRNLGSTASSAARRERRAGWLCVWLTACALGALVGPSPTLAQNTIPLDDLPAWSDDTSRNSLNIAWGDLDSDGDLDLVAGTLDQGTRVLVNVDGEMRLTVLPQTDLVADVALGDLDRDNRLDLVVATGVTDFCNFDPANCAAPDAVFMNTTTRADAVTWARLAGDNALGDAATETAAVVLADLDGDAWLDVVLGGRGGLRVYRNGQQQPLALQPRNGFCADASDLTPAMGIVTTLAAGDYDGDGDPDLAAAMTVPADVRNANPDVWFPDDSVIMLNNDSAAGCLRPHQMFPVANVSDLAWGDMSGDGLPELAVARIHDTVQVWPNFDGQLLQDCDVAGGLCWDSGTVDATTAVAWGDADSDGDLDLAVANRDTAPNAVYANDFGRLSPTPAWRDRLAHVTSDLAWGDVDNDGDLDLAAAVYAEPDFVYANSGVPLASAPDLYLGPMWVQMTEDGRIDWHAMVAQSVALGDVDQDGDLDLAVGYVRYQPCYGRPGLTVDVMQGAYEPCWGDAVDRVFLNENGTFNQDAAWTSQLAAPTVATAWGDVDADGDLDLVTAGIRGPLALYRNGAAGLETAPGCTAIGDEIFGIPPVTSMALADADQDGYLDVALGLFWGENRLYRFDPAEGCFVRAPWEPTLDGVPLVDATYSVTWGDVDNDGDLDLAVGNSANQPSDTLENRNFLFLNQRGVLDNVPSQFIGQNLDDGQTVFGYPTRSLAWGDMDNDGDLDLAEGVWSGQKRVYRNEDGWLDPIPAWVSADNDLTPQLTWVDIDSDGDMDLAAANVTLFRGTSNDVYRNQGGMLDAMPAWQSTSLDQTLSVAWGDVDLDGTPDLLFGNQMAGVQLHRGRRAGAGPNAARLAPELQSAPVTTASGAASTLLAPADGFSVPYVRGTDAISISVPFTLGGSDGGRFSRVSAEYTANGAAWTPAQTPALAAGPDPCAYDRGGHVYPWLITPPRGDAFMGQSSAVRLRLSAIRCVLPVPFEVAGSYTWATLSAQTYPFAVRGRQVRVVDETGAPVLGAQAFTRGSGEQTATRLADASGVPYQTDANGYLQGYGRLAAGDQLAAVWPSQYITTPFQARLFFTSAPITADGLAFNPVISGQGVQTLTVSSARPLVVFDMDISLEWDARNDLQFMQNLESAIENASATLFDVTNGQVALGEVHIHHNKEYWDQAHIVIYAANNVRPRATQGGIVDVPVAEEVVKPDGTMQLVVDAYNSGQIRMGPLWDPFGQSQAELSGDWWRALAHELGHYLLFLNDNYLGISDQGPVRTIANVNCRGSLMTNAYDARNYDEFVADQEWATDDDCQRSLANVTTGRSDWATITKYFAPWLTAPAAPPECPGDAICGPEALPLDITEVCWVLPDTGGRWMTCGAPAEETGGALLMAARRYDIRNAGGDLLPLYQGQAYLYRMAPGSTPDAEDEVVDVIALGSTGNLRDSIVVRGAQRNDRVCVFTAGAEPHAGCVDVGPETNSVQLAQLTDWAPKVTIDSVAESTVLSVTVLLTPTVVSGTLWAQVFPQYANLPITILDDPDAPVRTVRDKVRLEPAGYDADGRVRYVGIVEPRFLATEGLVRVWVEPDAGGADGPPREAFAQYYLTPEWFTSLPGNARATNPGNARATNPGNARATNPGNARATNPGNARATNPGNARATNPGNARATNPGNARATNPGNARATNPGNARATNPGNARATNPGNARATNPGNARALTAGRRALGAPVASGDGQVSIYNVDDLFGSTNVLALHALTTIPDAPSWLTSVGKSYRVVLADDVRAAIAFSYLQRDVPAGYEYALRVYYLADRPDAQWRPLPTTLDQNENLAVAELADEDQGNGTYALIATVELPPLAPGWNVLSYPVAVTNTVSSALASIADDYSILYRYAPDTVPQWTQFDPQVAVHQPAYAPYVNTLTHMALGQTYLIAATAPVTASTSVTASTPVIPRLPIDVVPAETDQRAPTVAARLGTDLPVSTTLTVPPPALLFGPVALDVGLAAQPGDVVTARVDGVDCGRAVLMDGPDGALIFVLHVHSAAAHIGCGTDDAVVTLDLGGRTVATVPWDNRRAQFVTLGEPDAGALPCCIEPGTSTRRAQFPREQR